MPAQTRDPEGPDLAAIFRRFGEHEARGTSAVYERLALQVAEDPDLLALAGAVPGGQPAPNLLFGAVQYLRPGGIQDPGEFRAFCLENAEALRRLFSSRTVQTNEVGRCALLLPALAEALRGDEARPVALLDIGCSAGLNLFLDRYRYRYVHPGREVLGWGAGDGGVLLECESRGAPPPLPSRPVGIVARRGIDLSPVDLRDEDSVRWLRALIWPGRPERVANLLEAVRIAREVPPLIARGSAVDLLPCLLDAMPADAVVVAIRSFVWRYVSLPDRERIDATLLDASRRRTVLGVFLEAGDGRIAEVVVRRHEDGRAVDRRVALGHPHGLWIEWSAV